MSEPKHGKSARDLAIAASITAAAAQAHQRHAEARADYDQQTRDLYFTKHFNTALEAVMRDYLATDGERFMAWLERYSWGEYSLFAKAIDGTPKHQVDASIELGIHKSRISHLVSYYEKRGRLITTDKGKRLCPVIAPVLGPVPGQKVASDEFQTFVADWKVAHSSDFQELEDARSVVKRIRKVLLSDYKLFKQSAKKDAVSLLEIARELPGELAAPESLTPFQENVLRRQQQTQANGDPDAAGSQSMGHPEACAFLFREIARMQTAYPKSEFANPPIDRANPDHELLLDLIVKKLGSTIEEYLVGYVVWVACNFKGLGSGTTKYSRSRPPGSTSGPKTLGLLVYWAEDYARVNAIGGQRETTL